MEKENKNVTATDKSMVSYIQGKDPEEDAWYTSFFIENHIDHSAYPDLAASPEQVRFMVYSEDNERYYPCSDRMFNRIMMRNRSLDLEEKYQEVLKKILDLIEHQIDDPYEKKYLKALIYTKYNHETKDWIMIPSRLEKRLLKIYLNKTQIEDPYLHEKKQRNAKASRILHSKEFKDALDYVDDKKLIDNTHSLETIKTRINDIKLRRLIALSVDARLWDPSIEEELRRDDFIEIFQKPLKGNGVERFWEFLRPSDDLESSGSYSKKILWLANEAGEIMIDLEIIRYLIQLGHKVIMAFKEGPLFNKVYLDDAQTDEELSKEMSDALLIVNPTMSKNDLIQVLKTDKSLLAISDGTRENLNLLLVTTTFARLFKEVDGIVSRGTDQRHRFLDTHFNFTQDIYSISHDDEGFPAIWFKSRHPDALKFSVKDLEAKANRIISQMKAAAEQGMTIMFYSGIIGSIPGKEHIAKKIMSTTIESINQQSAKIFIINPSEHSEPGMDADDLMYMWEIVQRSGLIDIWRFQTYEDIESAFQALNMKIPPEWVGKDATFSTGCTKEMIIASEMEKKHPEMQIIGPSKSKFSRRQEYGVGKMYDRRLDEVCSII